MEQYTVRGQKALRRGFTTGSCAAAAAAAAVRLLLTGQAPAAVCLQTPGGALLSLDVEDAHMEAGAAVCAVRKDAGDDPDVTNGIRIFASVRRGTDGIQIDGGAGVGRVTRPGLACAPGQAAINPAPREQIERAVRRAAAECGDTGGFSVVISAERGEETAKQTFNERLGIVGGISILGTTGIVEPMSERALVDTIHIELDSRFAAGERDLLACPGAYGRTFVRQTLGVDLAHAVTISNFIGETLDYAVFKGFASLLLIGHAGKLIKLAAGVMQTHSAYADARQEILAAHAALCGAPQQTVQALMEAVSVDACLDCLDEVGLTRAVLESAGEKIMRHIGARVHGALRVETVLFTNTRGELWRSPEAGALLAPFQEKTI
ncbi:cobalt-precorrin-5B (C(1))-methyltransferase CbiD [Agathobaculum sp.]|uniref:cobalt-precorrin-5B (C(1))-methyltransferase CbiD n=1 Tax=Agathobaculum sp. TaxID=2048138 RepID=UPI002A81256F|nr:cobalt-precorrin-5B (C(1))-methyltransferase CbiD [Agathobaculum sp.]MDY3619044.1 cobalt-precorrin-5B (C(1))-methyltransferase CbiD [Agathobaculum sp.]